jgi:carboxylesterase type B
MVWIHGGGYGTGGNGFDFTPIIGTNHNRFIVVSIQYRLGAFGFLSSDEVHRFGTPNAGILDQQLALQWVQQYIHLFGGDHTKVTIFGESAGAGSVMLHDIAYGGTLGTSLFRNSITSSPYLPFQYGYADWQPSQAYYAFAAAAGCDTKDAYLHGAPFSTNTTKSIFKCLTSASHADLVAANVQVSQSGTWGTWAFLPVTDGRIIQDRPSKALAENRVNGVNHLAGHNAMEGASWVPPVVNTIEELVYYLETTFPMFDNNDIAKILYYYPSSNATDNPNAPLYATLGDSGPTTVNQSIAATGQMERAIAIYGETTFICPSYWLAEAYSDNAWGGQGYKYQFSPPSAYHGADGAAFLSAPYSTSYYGTDFVYAFQTMYGNFIVNDDPSVPSSIANGVTLDPTNTTFNPLSEFPSYAIYPPRALMDLNTTCPTVTTVGTLPYCTGTPTEKQRTRFHVADAYTWEGGRGVRCDFWKSMGELVPE